MGINLKRVKDVKQANMKYFLNISTPTCNLTIIGAVTAALITFTVKWCMGWVDKHNSFLITTAVTGLIPKAEKLHFSHSTLAWKFRVIKCYYIAMRFHFRRFYFSPFYSLIFNWHYTLFITACQKLYQHLWKQHLLHEKATRLPPKM